VPCKKTVKPDRWRTSRVMAWPESLVVTTPAGYVAFGGIVKRTPMEFGTLSPNAAGAFAQPLAIKITTNMKRAASR